MLYLQCNTCMDGEHSPNSNFIADNYHTEYHESAEIQESFETPEAYRNAVLMMVMGSVRKEWTIRDSNDDTVALLVTVKCPDIHYNYLSAAIILWVKPAYRGNQHVARLMIKAQQNSAIQTGCKYMVRTSKITPFITKQIVRRVI